MARSDGQTLSLFEETRLTLAQLSLTTARDLLRGLENATRTSALTLGAARVGVWLWLRDREELRCLSMYDAEANEHRSGDVLDVSRYPNYARALKARRVIVADDAVTDADTAELAASYLLPLGITSMLDAPLYRSGEVVGVVCHEHRGPRRSWTVRERDLAASVADLIAVLLEQGARMDLEHELVLQRERAARTEKAEALARLSAGVAHDFNSILSVAMLQAETIRRTTSDAKIGSAAQAIVEEAAFGGRLVRQLLLYAREERPPPIDIEVRRFLERTQPTLSHLAGGLQLRIESDDLPRGASVHAPITHLEQVLANLVMNARDAGASEITICASGEDDECLLSVRDDGDGMDETTRLRVFEPFFTTKGHGSGIGLSAVQSIVDLCGGRIEVESAKGQGTTFRVRLPRTD